MQRNGSRGPRAPMFHRSQTTATRISGGMIPLTGFTTHRMHGGMYLGLKIADLTLVLHGNERPARTKFFSFNGRTDAQARQWLGEQLGARGINARALDEPSPYEIPAH